MLKEEFNKHTGFEPTETEYLIIEGMYYDFNGSKEDFCKDFAENGGTKKLREEVDKHINFMQKLLDEWVNNERETMEKHKHEIGELKKQLEKEHEWRPYESEHNVKQAAYEQLAASVEGGAAHYMTTDEAKILVNREFGFETEKIQILCGVDVEEIDRHNCCRRTGEEHDRKPVYCATDDYYVRFNCAGWSYEAHNGELTRFY